MLEHNDIALLVAAMKESREPVDFPVQLSNIMPWMVSYHDRKHLYIFSPIQLAISLEDYGNIIIPSGTWHLFDFPAGMRIFATNVPAAAPIYAYVKATDELLTLDYFQTPSFSSNNVQVAPSVVPFVVKSSAGALISVTINTSGTTGFVVYDNATTTVAPNAVPLYTSIAAPQQGSAINIFGWGKLGITVVGTTTGPNITVHYS